jgi:hypothetical protein
VLAGGIRVVSIEALNILTNPVAIGSVKIDHRDNNKQLLFNVTIEEM